MNNREYNVIAMLSSGKTKWLSGLFTSWVDNRTKALSFEREQAEYLVDLVKSENSEEVIDVYFFPKDIEWQTEIIK